MEKKQISHDDTVALLKAIDDLPKANAQLTTKLYYALTKNRRPLHNAAKEIEAVLGKIFEDWSNEDNDAKKKLVPEQDVQDYNSECKDFLQQTTEFEFYQFPYNDLEKDMPKLTGVAGIYLIIEFIIKDDSDQAKQEVPDTEIKYEATRKPSSKKEAKLDVVKEDPKEKEEMAFEEKAEV